MAFDKTKFLNELDEMKVSELNELVKAIEEKFGVTAAMPTAAAASTGEAESDEKTLTLTSAGGSKISVIKVVREILGLGLMEAKKFVDGAPSVIKENVSKEEAEGIIAKFKEAGAEVEAK